MYSAICWIPPGIATKDPQRKTTEPWELEQAVSAKEAEAQEDAADEEEEGEMDLDPVEKMEDEQVDINKLYDLDSYDKEPDGLDDIILQSTLSNIFYKNTSEDPNLKEEGDSDDEFQIKESDALLLACKTVEELGHLEVYLLDTEAYASLSTVEGVPGDIFYMHNDIMLEEFPLCVESVTSFENEVHNLAAVGTFAPAIDIWDLDSIDAVEPILTLGGMEKVVNRTDTPKRRRRAKKKKKPQMAFLEGSHTKAVLTLSWNRIAGEKSLASGSADTTVKIWDIEAARCTRTFEAHEDIVQSVVWHHSEENLLVSGSLSGNLLINDSRSGGAAGSVAVGAEIECITWNPFIEHNMIVSTDTGTVLSFDCRNLAAPQFTLSAHNSEVSAVALSQKVPNMMATASGDASAKIWNISDGRPSMVVSRNFESCGPIFDAQFLPGENACLAVAGKAGKKPVLWNVLADAAVSEVFH